MQDKAMNMSVQYSLNVRNEGIGFFFSRTRVISLIDRKQSDYMPKMRASDYQAQFYRRYVDSNILPA